MRVEPERQPTAGIGRELAGGGQTIGNECCGNLENLEPAGASSPEVEHQDGVASEEADAEHDGTGVVDEDGNPIAGWA